MNGGTALTLGVGTVATVDTFKGEPGNPSPGIPMDKVQAMGIQAVWTGTPVGNFTVQVSNDNVTFTTLSGSSVAAGGAAGNFYWKDSSPAYKYVQVSYTGTSGSGSATVKLYKLTRNGL